MKSKMSTKPARAATAALAALSLLAAAAPQAAADAKSAEKAFRKGKKLQQQKKYDEACPAFEESFKEDPAIGAQLNVARCYEEWGKLATALEAYREALKLARATKDDRTQPIKDLVATLDKRVPVLILSLPKGRLPPPGFTVTLDGAEVQDDQLGQPMRVDPGKYTLVTRSDDGEPQTTEVVAVNGKTLPVELAIDAEPAKPDKPAKPAKPAKPDKPEGGSEKPGGDEDAPAADEGAKLEVKTAATAGDPGRGRRRIAYIVGGVGLIGAGVATYLALDARSDYDAAFDGNCDPDTKQCTPEAATATNDARSQANTASIIGGVAAAAVLTGAILYFSAPKAERKRAADADAEASARKRAVRPMLLPGGAGVVFSGAL